MITAKVEEVPNGVRLTIELETGFITKLFRCTKAEVNHELNVLNREIKSNPFDCMRRVTAAHLDGGSYED